MKKIYTAIFFIAMTIPSVLLSGCKKYLDEKSDTKLVVPNTLADLQGLMDYHSRINNVGLNAVAVSSDDYYVSPTNFAALADEQKRTYTWEKDKLFIKGINDWSKAYDRIYLANIVLDNLPGIEKNSGNELEWNNIKAQAHFIRAFAYLEAVITWGLVYDAATATASPGLPLRLTSSITEKITRQNLQQTYDLILDDLHAAATSASNQVVHPVRPGKPAAYALLARTYMAMGDYENCLKYADLCLQLKNDLLDFNVPILNPNADFPFSHNALMYNNPELIYINRIGAVTILQPSRAKIDSLLYRSYHTDDLRRRVYFKVNADQTQSFKGGLAGGFDLFNGPTTGEVYLMRAECYARKGMVDEAMDDLNALTIKRWDQQVTYVPFTAASGPEALQLILIERRKELVMRGLRWMDLKRLNKEGANISLKRLVNTREYTLPPNDKRFALSIPEYIIELNGIPQNDR